MKALCNVTVRENRQIGDCLWLVRLMPDGDGARLLQGIQPGMFMMLRCDEGDKLRFRRPFSFADVDATNGTFSLYYRVLGQQTRILSQAVEGTVLSAVLPLGNSFSAPENDEELVIVAGGIGVAPLLLLTREVERSGRPKPRFYFGARTDAELCLDFIGNYAADFRLSTDDGSHGRKGTVVEHAILDGLSRKSHICACGPPAMLKALQAALPHEMSAEVSLEAVMACGIGACYGCAVRTNGLGVDENKLVCRDGPVFPLRSINFG